MKYKIFRILKHFAKLLLQINTVYIPRDRHKKPVLIYGANEESFQLINYLLSNPYHEYYPIGFIDNDATPGEQYFIDYPVFGGFWKLEEIINQHAIRCIIIATGRIKPEIFKRVKQISERKGINLLILYNTHFGITLKPLPIPLSRDWMSALYKNISGIRRN